MTTPPIHRQIVLSPTNLAIALVLVAAVAWSYWPILSGMEKTWWNDTQYSHGYVVPVFAVFLLWSRRSRLDLDGARPSWAGLALLVFGELLRGLGTFVYLDWLQGVALIPLLAGLTMLVGGWPALRWAWPALAFLVFMVPLPYFVEMKFAGQLQSFAAQSSTFVLQTIGFPALADGTRILVDKTPIDVVKACSGLSMLLVFFALSVAVSLMMEKPLLDRIVVVVSAIPIALIANVTRITTTGILYETTSNERVRHYFHDWAGLFMMVYGLLLLLAELKFMSWLLVEEEPNKPAPMSPFKQALGSI